MLSCMFKIAPQGVTERCLYNTERSLCNIKECYIALLTVSLWHFCGVMQHFVGAEIGLLKCSMTFQMSYDSTYLGVMVTLLGCSVACLKIAPQDVTGRCLCNTMQGILFV